MDGEKKLQPEIKITKINGVQAMCGCGKYIPEGHLSPCPHKLDFAAKAREIANEIVECLNGKCSCVSHGDDVSVIENQIAAALIAERKAGREEEQRYALDVSGFVDKARAEGYRRGLETAAGIAGKEIEKILQELAARIRAKAGEEK